MILSIPGSWALPSQPKCWLLLSTRHTVVHPKKPRVPAGLTGTLTRKERRLKFLHNSGVRSLRCPHILAP
jgi:hypothetical protein